MGDGIQLLDPRFAGIVRAIVMEAWWTARTRRGFEVRLRYDSIERLVCAAELGALTFPLHAPAFDARQPRQV
jgi:hypothetical protein